MPQLLLIAAVLILAFYVLQVLFLASVPAMAAVVAFALVAIVHRMRWLQSLDEQLNRLLRVQETDEGVRFWGAPPSQADMPDTTPVWTAGIGAALLVGGLAFLHLHKTGWFLQVALQAPPKFTLVLALIMAIGISGYGFYLAWQWIIPKNLAVQHLDRRAEQLNLKIDNPSALQEAWRTNTRLRQSLGGGTRSLTNLMKSTIGQSAMLPGGPLQALHGSIDDETAALREESQRLQALVATQETLLRTYDEACSAANRIGNQALLRYLDLVSNGIAALAILAQNEDWDTLDLQFRAAQSELDRALQNLDQLDEETQDNVSDSSSAAPAYDPYAVLGIEHSARTEDIKRLVQRLSQIYHPDGKDWVDNSRLTEINRAWQAIKAERGVH